MAHLMADASFFERRRVRPAPRLIQPEDATLAFNYQEAYTTFTHEEALQFAIAFKKTPKAFDIIAEQIPNRSRVECRKHYYDKKFDGRFKTTSWEETNDMPGRKKYSALSELDRRMHGFTITEDGVLPEPTLKEDKMHRTRLMKLIPINEEVDRLLALLPGAEVTYAAELAAAQNAQDADRKADHQMVKPQKRANKRARGKAFSKGKKAVGELPVTLQSVSGEVERILKDTRKAREIFEEAKSDFDAGDDMSESNMQMWRRFHKLYISEVKWLNKSLDTLYNNKSEIRPPGDEDISGTVFAGMISVKMGVSRLESKKMNLQARLARLDEGGGPSQEQATVIQETLAGQDMELAQLEDLVQMLNLSTTKTLEEECAVTGEPDYDANMEDVANGQDQEHAEYEGDDEFNWAEDGSSEEEDDDMDSDYED